MRHLLLLALVLIGCDPPAAVPPPPDYSGKIGYSCYKNLTCDGGVACISWKVDGKTQSVCAQPQDITIGAFELVKCLQECPPTECPGLQLHCPPLPKPVTCPPQKECPKAPMGPCQECPACPAWKR